MVSPYAASRSILTHGVQFLTDTGGQPLNPALAGPSASPFPGAREAPGRALMSLVLNPRAGSADDYNVLHGELQVGQIYKRKAALRPESQWLWALNGVPAGSDIHALTGLAATLDDFMVALTATWTKMAGGGGVAGSRRIIIDVISPSAALQSVQPRSMMRFSRRLAGAVAGDARRLFPLSVTRCPPQRAQGRRAIIHSLRQSSYTRIANLWCDDGPGMRSGRT